ncbi:MAG: double-strand break repair protein AddB, partial [Amphiplicatus sp.]
FYAEEVAFSELADLVPVEHAAHWGRTLDFLRIVTEAWPAHLSERGLMDPAERRAKLIDAQAERLSRATPNHPVIVAGTTGSAPAVARLMQTVAALPKGAVVLPGLDRALARDAKAWAVIEDPHPQAGLKALLGAFKLDPAGIAPWPGSDAQCGAAAHNPRAPLLSLALRPAEATDDWRDEVAKASAADPALENACDGLTLIEAADEEAEAAAIALLMRETLDSPGRTAMLVTPDRNLSRRVAAKMRRWSVIVDDSAGVPFANSPCGTYLRLAALWLDAPNDPHAALSLALSTLAGFGLDDRTRAKAVAAVDEGLRGLAPAAGVAGLRAKVAAAAIRKPTLAERAAPLIEQMDEAAQGWPARAAPFTTLLDAHIAVAEKLAATDSEDGAKRLWRGEDGEAGAMLLADLRLTAGALGDIAPGDYARAFAQLLAGAIVRRRAPAHPRLAILGPLEARLQSADLVILGGLNEGVWPGDAGADPFLSRAMREKLGLPSPERRVGLAAHDFAQGAAAPKVALTRARRLSGAPAKPSRWIVRLKNILAGAGALETIDASARFAAWTEALDDAGLPVRAKPPKPTPPVEARPRALFVTRVEKWLRDPYSIYAQYVLGLRKLDRVGEPFDARHLGNLLLKVFERAALNGASRDELGALFAEEAARHGFGAVEYAFWGPSIEKALTWFAAFHAERLAQGAPIVLEQNGAAICEAAGGPFTLSAKPDRIDLLKNGEAYLFDYKSGTIPSPAQMKTFRVQLPLTALIAERGGFDALGPARIAGFQYLKTLGRKADNKGNETGADGAEAQELMRETGDGLIEWINAFDDQSTPYCSQPRPQFTDDFG